MNGEVELYAFTTNAGTYRYTSAAEDVIAGGQTYTAAAIGRGAVAAMDELSRCTLDITTTRSLIYVTDAMGNYDYGTVAIQAWDGDSETWSTIWRGRCTGIVLSGGEATISTESILTCASRLGLFGKWQILCRHALYGTACGVDPEDFDYAGTVSVVSGRTVTVPGLDGEADGYYTGGYAHLGDGYALVTSHAGNVITLLNIIPGLAAGATAYVYAGCDRKHETCAAKFSNLDNFGGFPWMPQPASKGSINPLASKVG